MRLLILLLIPNFLLALELNLLCTNSYPRTKDLDVKDMFLLLDSDTKKIDLGGLSFFADDISITKSNISWKASNINLFPESNGDISAILGRYSGELILNFTKYNEDKRTSLVFKCRKFKIKERMF
ncbi:MAG: hypothetical protein ACJ0G4_00145 [Alphaproteobacteria bacterium]|tara:strand:+ start:155 stop:529 length:375 start_codon:yes stop_codon:yes gene_type:complete